jgi:cob(I)alamin adenosyltransferase
VIRRAERRVSELAEEGELASETVIHFLNRASDLAFAMARYADVEDPALFQGRERNS